jgi:hypothetical protein
MAPRTATKMLSFAALAGSASGALPDDVRLRTISERVTVAECVDSTSFPAVQEYFLPSLRVGLLPLDAVRTTEMTVQAAYLISVRYGNNSKVLTEETAKEQYIWTQRGTTAPTDAEISAVAPLEAGYLRKHFLIPLQKVSTGCTSGLGFLRRLDVQGRVSHADQFAPGPCWQKAHACGGQLEASWGGNATIREAQLNAAEAVFIDGRGKCKMLRARPIAVHFYATNDNANLHSAETSSLWPPSSTLKTRPIHSSAHRSLPTQLPVCRLRHVQWWHGSSTLRTLGASCCARLPSRLNILQRLAARTSSELHLPMFHCSLAQALTDTSFASAQVARMSICAMLSLRIL